MMDPRLDTTPINSGQREREREREINFFSATNRCMHLHQLCT